MAESNKQYKPGLKNDDEQLYIERAFLGSVLLGGGIPEEISIPMFRFLQNQKIFAALKTLKKTCTPDLRILINHLKEAGELDTAGGTAYIAELTSLLPTSGNIGYYSDELTESHYRRSVDGMLVSTRNDLAEGKPLEEIIEQLRGTFRNCQRKGPAKKGRLNGASVLTTSCKNNSPWPSGLWKAL
jgi:replicative DNA helicase